MDRGERRHNRRVSGYERRALRLMRRAAAEAARLVQLYGGAAAAGGGAFRIDQSMPLRRAVDALLKDLHASLLEEVQRGVYREWTVAESEADALAARAEGMYPVRAERGAWRTHRDAAREAFAARRERGLSLSDRVWRVVDGFAREVEAAATDAIGNGTPAERLATSIKQHLNEPNRLYRRVRTPGGKLRLSKAAAAYHPGRGVYRSSFMNARRLAVTETNMAYRAADFERWQQMDFVVGIEIRLSNNHNCKGVPPGTFHDICDELAGRYPKEFKFTGWHPHCRCHAVPILKRPEEMAQPEAQSANAVTELPEAFKAYVEGNRGRIATAAARGALPYFLRDNFTVAANGTLAARWGGGDRVGARAVGPILLLATFPPFSPRLVEEAKRLRGNKDVNALYESVLNDPAARVLHDLRGVKTTVHPGHKGVKSKLWGETVRMAECLNRAGYDVCFLPEMEEVSCADALLRLGHHWQIADFKYSSVDNYNTIAKEIAKGFTQADCVVLQIEKGNANTMYRAIEQLNRNSERLGDLMVITRRGKVLVVRRNDLMNERYKKIIRGRM